MPPKPSPQPSTGVEPSAEAKAAAYAELVRPRCRQAIADKRESDKALTAAYQIDTPAIHAAGVAEGRAEAVAFVRKLAGSAYPEKRGKLHDIADDIEAAFPTTGEKTDG